MFFVKALYIFVMFFSQMLNSFVAVVSEVFAIITLSQWLLLMLRKAIEFYMLNSNVAASLTFLVLVIHQLILLLFSKDNHIVGKNASSQLPTS